MCLADLMDFFYLMENRKKNSRPGHCYVCDSFDLSLTEEEVAPGDYECNIEPQYERICSTCKDKMLGLPKEDQGESSH